MADGSELPSSDALRHLKGGTWKPSTLTKPPDVASYLWSILAAERLKIIAPDEAERRLERTLTAIERLERVHGFFIDTLDPRTGKALKTWPSDGKPVRPIMSGVDNGWLATALIMIRNTCPRFRARADAILKPMDFGFFYEPYVAADPLDHPGQIRGPFRIDENTFGGFNRILNTEQRIAFVHRNRARRDPSGTLLSRSSHLVARRTAAESDTRWACCGPTSASPSSRATTRTGEFESSRVGVAACSRL